MEKFKTLLKTDKTGLIKGYCKVPWQSFLINQTGNIFACNCEGKVKKSIGNILNISQKNELINLLESNDFKNSILNDSYRFCYGNSCELIQKNMFFNDTLLFANSKEELEKIKYDTVYLQIDESCNLQCPSCRDRVIIHKNNDVSRKIDKILSNFTDYFLNEYRDDICVRLCGSGELFASPSINKWFLNFDFEKYSNVNFYLHSNATLWDKNKDFLITNAKRINGTEISIDAATSKMYSIVRKRGNWNDLLSGLSLAKYMKTINPNFQITISFVVSNQNYEQIQDFINFGSENNVNFVKFYRLQRLDMDEEKFNKLNIFNPSHPNHEKFLQILKECKSPINTDISQISPWLKNT